MRFGPGEYVPDPTEGIIHIRDLPAPEIVPYDRNHEHTSCPRCGHLAYRHKWGHRTLHDLGDLYRDCPVDLLVAYWLFRTSILASPSAALRLIPGESY